MKTKTLAFAAGLLAGLACVILGAGGAQQLITIGTTANDHTGDSLLVQAQKVNANFTELYGRHIFTTSPLTGGGDLTGDLTLGLGTITVAQGATGISSYAVGDLLAASGTTTLSRVADVAAGSYMRSGGVATLPAWSTLVLPNAAVQGAIMAATSANTEGAIAAVAAGSLLRSAGVSTLPVWSTPTYPNAATTGDLLTASASNVYAELADVAAGSALLSGGVGVLPAWGKVGPTIVDLTAAYTWTGAHASTGSPLTAATTRMQTGVAVALTSATTRTSTTVLTNTGLSVTVNELGTYAIDGMLYVSEVTSSAGGFRFDLAGGTAVLGATSFYAGGGALSGATYTTNGTGGPGSFSDYPTISLSATNPGYVIVRGNLVVTTVGTVVVRASQSTSSANATSLQAGSYLRLTKLA